MRVERAVRFAVMLTIRAPRSCVMSRSSEADAEGGEWPVGVAAVVAQRGGEVARPGPAERADDQVAPAGHDLRAGPGPGLRGVLGKGHVPHTYATDRLSIVVFGTWWVNSGKNFASRDATPVGPGGYVRRVARTPHYDGMLPGHPDPAVIAIFGIGPVDMRLVDPTKPAWRHI
jgi:hypothetical protein